MKREKLYIAGPMCFYEDGYPRWYVMRDRARVKDRWRRPQPCSR